MQEKSLSKFFASLFALFLAIIFSAEAVPLYTAVPVSDIGSPNGIGEANTSRNVAVAPDGSIFVVFSGSAGIRVAKSTNNGASFLSSVLVGQGNYEAEIEIASNGYIYVAWLAGMNVYFTSSTNNGNSFSIPAVIGSISSGSGVHIASYGSNVYVLERIGRILYTNSLYGVGPFIAKTIDLTRVFSDVRVDPTTGVVYVMTDDPLLRLYTSLDNGSSFIPTTIVPSSNVNYSSYTLSVGTLGIKMFVFGLTGQAFKINLVNGNSTALTCGISQNSLGRTLASDSYGNLIDGYYNSGLLKYRVSFDQGTSWQLEVPVSSGGSHNVTINPINHNILVVYELNGQVFLNSYKGELKTVAVSTNSISNQTCNSAVVNGVATDYGTNTAGTRGVVYSVNSDFSNSTIIETGSGAGSISQNITDLCPGTTYYAKAYVKDIWSNYWYGEVVEILSPGVTVTEAVDKTVSACEYANQEEADAAFEAWLATASVSGGCSPTTLYTVNGCPYQKGFAGNFAPANWTLTNTNGGNGYVITTGAPNSIQLIGSNNGAGGSNYTNYKITIPCAGTISFNWDYTSYDRDGPYYDRFGYTVNNTFSQLTNNSGSTVQSGTKSIHLSSGSTFSFSIYSIDQILGTGVEITSAFTFTPDFIVPNYCDGGSTEVIWTIEDDCYGPTSYSATFTITPNTPPEITSGPESPQIRATDAGLCSYKAVGTEFDILATDDCADTYPVTIEYKLEGVTEGTGENTLEGVDFSFGETTVTWTVTDRCGLTDVHSFVVNVNKVTTVTKVVVDPTSQQYSDLVKFTATVVPYNCNLAGNAAESVTFYVEGQEMGTVDLDEFGVAEASYAMLEPTPDAAYGEGTMSPGTKTVTAVFNEVDPDFIVEDPQTPLTITCENASVTYNGNYYFGANPNTQAGTVVLSASILDADDGYRGDIRNANLLFSEGSTQLGNTLLVGLIDPSNTYEGNGTTQFDYTLSGSELGEGGKIWTVKSYTDGYYCGSDAPAVVTLAMPGGDFVTGGGHIILENSSGQYPGTNGKKMNFGLVMKWNKSGKNLQGHVNIIYRGMYNGQPANFQIKSNAINSMSVVNVKEGGVITFRKASIDTKANLKVILADGTEVSIDGGLSLSITAWESTTVNNGSLDRISVQLAPKNGSGILFSSNWISGATKWQTLNGGKIQARNEEIQLKEGDYEGGEVAIAGTGLNVYPNPFHNNATIQFSVADNENVSILITNSLGIVVRELLSKDISAGDYTINWDGLGTNNQLLSSGVYYITLTSGSFVKTVPVTLIK